jgi:hypothetical protein
LGSRTSPDSQLRKRQPIAQTGEEIESLLRALVSTHFFCKMAFVSPFPYQAVETGNQRREPA